jgi:hypothetical protein
MLLIPPERPRTSRSSAIAYAWDDLPRRNSLKLFSVEYLVVLGEARTAQISLGVS